MIFGHRCFLYAIILAGFSFNSITCGCTRIVKSRAHGFKAIRLHTSDTEVCAVRGEAVDAGAAYLGYRGMHSG